MRSLILLVAYLSFLVIGTSAPFIIGLGYVWTDIMLPQRVAWSILPSIPVSAIMGAATVGAYLLFDRKDRPSFWSGSWLFVVWAAWVTMTTTWAEVPEPAWVKWDWAVKTILFAGFLPYLFRTRTHLEALILVMVSAMIAHMIPYAVKTAINGGGYDMSIGLIPVNNGWGGESSTFATACAALLPILMWCKDHSRILPRQRLLFLGMGGIALVGLIGSYARTGLVALAVVAGAWWLQSRRKVLWLIAFAAIGSAGMAFTTDQWMARMSTITTYGKEESALGRVAVWLWTLDYVKDHPLGGGFEVYRINTFKVPIEGSHNQFLEIRGKAFHSIYFEVLGEHGWPGAAIWGVLMLLGLWQYWAVIRRTKGSKDLLWLRELAKALLIAMLAFLAGGAFIGIAFQPFLYDFVAISISLSQLVRAHRHELDSHREASRDPIVFPRSFRLPTLRS